jgi:hypothetical protein
VKETSLEESIFKNTEKVNKKVDKLPKLPKRDFLDRIKKTDDNVLTSQTEAKKVVEKYFKADEV